MTNKHLLSLLRSVRHDENELSLPPLSFHKPRSYRTPAASIDHLDAFLSSGRRRNGLEQLLLELALCATFGSVLLPCYTFNVTLKEERACISCSHSEVYAQSSYLQCEAGTHPQSCVCAPMVCAYGVRLKQHPQC